MAEQSTARHWSAARLTALVALLALALASLALGMPRAAGAESDSGDTSTVPGPSGSTSAATPTATGTDEPTATGTSSPTDEPSSTPSATSTPSTEPSDEPSTVPTAGPTGPSTVTQVAEATLYWSLNNESNNKAHAPFTYNFFSAGVLSNGRKPDNTIAESQFRATSGNVTIQKYLNGAWRTARWSDTQTDEHGVKISSPTAGRFSHLQMAFGQGTGTVDAARGNARIAWTGTATVVGYSGMNSFRITDPVLTVTGGKGTVTARLSGYGTDRENGSEWVEFTPRTVTLADLPAVDLSGSTFTATPAYTGVRTPAGLEAAQVTDGAWGAFPASFLSFADVVGVAPFFYTSGGVTDAFKKAAPLTVSFTGVAPPAPEPVPGTGGKRPGKDPAEIAPPTVKNPPKATSAPTQPSAPSSGGGVQTPSSLTGVPAQVQQPVTVAGALPANSSLTAAQPELSLVAAHPAEPVVSFWWWSAAGLLLLAAALLAVPAPRRAPSRP